MAGGKLKEAGFIHWNSPNVGATNSSGFTALPGGARENYGAPGNVGGYANFWTSNGGGSGVNKWASARALPYHSSYAGSFGNSRTFGYSLRCIRN
jgi:uncharacterized protein (TIGR02145 family)